MQATLYKFGHKQFWHGHTFHETGSDKLMCFVLQTYLGIFNPLKWKSLCSSSTWSLVQRQTVNGLSTILMPLMEEGLMSLLDENQRLESILLGSGNQRYRSENNAFLFVIIRQIKCADMSSVFKAVTNTFRRFANDTAWPARHGLEQHVSGTLLSRNVAEN